MTTTHALWLRIPGVSPTNVWECQCSGYESPQRCDQRRTRTAAPVPQHTSNSEPIGANCWICSLTIDRTEWGVLNGV